MKYVVINQKRYMCHLGGSKDGNGSWGWGSYKRAYKFNEIQELRKVFGSKRPDLPFAGSVLESADVKIMTVHDSMIMEIIES